MPKILVTRKIIEDGINLLLSKGYEVEINPHNRPLTREELLERIKDKDAVITQLVDRVDKDFFDVGKNVKIVANYAVGYDNIDLEEATRRGVYITNTPNVLNNATAELAWTLLFSVARRVIVADRFMRTGQYKGWDPLLFLGKEITGKTLGIIGMGRIGFTFAKMSKGFNMRVLYYDVYRNETAEKEIPAEYVDLDTLLKESDFISIHVPLTSQTRHLISERELKLMKNSAIIINTSRGPVVDEKALVKALKEGWIWGAGLDVYEREPDFEPELSQLENVVMLPHIGSATEEARRGMSILCAENIIDFFDGRIPRTLVNKEVLNKR
jgi:D-3-phosphoglycerate dehydrogenase